MKNGMKFSVFSSEDVRKFKKGIFGTLVCCQVFEPDEFFL